MALLLRVVAVLAVLAGTGALTPTYHGCAGPNASGLPYCDASRPVGVRVADIIGRLSLADKISQGSPTDAPHYCGCVTAPISAIGMPQYRWLTEVNTVVGGATCPVPGRCPTVFVGPLNMAASFNRSSWWRKGDVMSNDVRALNNAGAQSGLTGFGPNINLVKDPRYGRNSELPGEDPLLSGEYAIAYVQGMQQVREGQLKMLAYLKHYTAYSVESSRFTFSANVSIFTLRDSNLRQYQMAFEQGGASGAMCSYFAPNGVSSCGNNWLLNGLIRQEWQRPDAVVMSDCSAVANMMKNVMKLNETQASAQAMNAGLDIYGGWGDHLWTEGFLAQAVAEGLTDEATITKSLNRTLTQKMRVGLFDAPSASPWASIGPDSLNSSYSRAVAYDAALQGMILLKNKGALPLKPGLKLLVLGPLGNDALLYTSDYAQTSNLDTSSTIFTELQRANKGGSTSYIQGVQVSGGSMNVSGAVDAAKAADVVVLALGITHGQEHEGMDRTDTLLPGNQEDFAMQVMRATSKPVVVVLCNGGILSIDALVDPANAIVEAFNPAQEGPRALASLFFGVENKWGKLPVTIYDKDYSKQLQIQDMEFHTPPGRSYRYYTGTPLFAFGSGLSLTSFSHECTCSNTNIHSNHNGSCHCTVKNTGAALAGDEVVMVFHSVGDDIRSAIGNRHPVPLRQLIDFERTTVSPSAEQEVQFEIPVESLAITIEDGSKRVYPGSHSLSFSRGNGQDVVIKVTV